MSHFPAISFSEAAVRLSSICQEIDRAEDIDNLLAADFCDALTNVTASIDRRKAFYRELESKIELSKKFREEVDRHIARYETIKDRLIEATKNVVQSNPDIEFKDSFGKQLRVYRNSVPRFVLDERWFENADESASEPYMKTLRVIDREKIKQTILDGGDVPFARLEYGTQLRGMK